MAAGFPSAAEDFEQRPLDLNDLLVQNPAATFFIRVEGHSMIDANIQSGDILIVDRSKEVANGQIVVARLGSEFLVKRFVKEKGCIKLRAESASYPDIVVGDEEDFQVWGVVTYVIHRAC